MYVNALWSDPGRWWGYASLGTETPPLLALVDPVFYQAWLSFIAKFTLKIPLLTLYAALLSVSMPWLWYRFFRELLPTKQLALIGWAILACLPSWIGVYSNFMSETLLLNLMGLSLWMSWRSYRKESVSSFALAVFCWCLAVLTRGAAIPFAAAITFFIWWQMDNKALNAITAGLIISFILGVMSYRSYSSTGMINPLGQPMLNQIYAQSGKKEIIINYFSSSSDKDFNYKNSSSIKYSYLFKSPSIGVAPFEPFLDWQSSRVDKGAITVNINLKNQSGSWQHEKRLSDLVKPSGLPLVMENLAFLFFAPSWTDNNVEHFFEWASNWLRFVWAPLFIIAVVLLTRMVIQGERKPVEGLIIFAVLLGAGRRSKIHKKSN